MNTIFSKTKWAAFLKGLWNGMAGIGIYCTIQYLGVPHNIAYNILKAATVGVFILLMREFVTIKTSLHVNGKLWWGEPWGPEQPPAPSKTITGVQSGDGDKGAYHYGIGNGSALLKNNRVPEYDPYDPNPWVKEMTYSTGDKVIHKCQCGVCVDLIRYISLQDLNWGNEPGHGPEWKEDTIIEDTTEGIPRDMGR